ncbi:MAG: N-acetylmuramoyl-L-alanine amidase [Bacteroidota bacterium]|nr:N-acetylmuramoyl-L-alanine amidase [Bacteroidota bacterium]
MSYEIIQRYISKNRSYLPLVARGTVVHETASPGDSDESEFNYFNAGAGGRSASAHAFIDNDSITNTVPWNEQAWHAGPTANHNFIGIELCNTLDPSKFQEIWNRAVWLFAYVHVNVIKVTAITKETLMSHAEVSAKWGETNHTDPVAYFANHGKTVDMFRAEVQEAINIMLNPANISYQAHVQDIGWQEQKKNGEVAGTEGQSLRMEALAINYDGPGNIVVEGHVQDIGWQAPRGNGEVIGTMGRSLRLEAVKIHLENAPGYHVEYQSHVEGMGWMDWCKGGEVSGTVGRELRLEAIKIRIIKD